MSNSVKKLTDLLQEKSDHLGDFLEEAKKVNEIIPTVKQAKEEADFALKMFGNMPSEMASEIDNKKVEYVLSEDLSFWKNNIPSLKIDTQRVTYSGSGASGTASEVVFSQIVSLHDTQKPQYVTWTEPYIDQYRTMQEKQDKASAVSKFISAVKPALKNEFDEANTAYIKADSGISDSKDAAIKMRNVLEHLLGNLVDKARQTPKEQVKQKVPVQWDFFSKRLAIGGEGSLEYSILSKKNIDHANLHEELTNLSKNLVDDPQPKLKVIYTKWIDHLYTTLFFIDINKL